MMPLLLAEAAPDMIKVWLECLAWLVGFVAGCVGIYTMLRKDGTPQPLVVEANKQYATQAEHAALAKKMDDELGRERSARKKIHEEIGQIQADISGLRTETEKQSTDLSEMKGDIKEVSALTSDTGGKVELMNQQLQQLTTHLLRGKS